MANLTFHILDVVAQDEQVLREDDEMREVAYESMEEDDSEFEDARRRKNQNTSTLGKRTFVVHLFGTTANGETVRVDVRGFQPFFFLRLPDNALKGVSSYISALRTYITKRLGPKEESASGLIGLRACKRKLLFGFTAGREYPFVEVKVPSKALFHKIKGFFLNENSKPSLSWALGAPFERSYTPKVYEANLDPFLRFMHLRSLRPCGWVTVSTSEEASEEEGVTVYSCDWEEIGGLEGAPPAVTAPFKVLSWDIECFSESGEFPMAKKGDPVIQIGCLLTKLGSKDVEKHIFTLGTCDPIEEVTVHAFKNERDMLLAWLKWVCQENVDILIGYNIFGFDEKYVWERCECLGLTESDYAQELNRLSMLGGQMRLDTKRLSSSAMGDNFLYLWNAAGRLRIDLFHVIKRGYALGSYKLDDTSRYFLSESVKGIDEVDSAWHMKIGATKQAVGAGRSIVLLNEGGDTLCEKVDLIEVRDGLLVMEKPFEVERDEVAKWAVVKDDVTPQQMFKLQKGSSSDRALIAKYCIQDCQLVLDLFRKLDVFNNAMSMANVCSVPVAYIFLRGQGIKIESLMFKYCYENNQTIEVLPQPAFGSAPGSDAEAESYEGAIVLDPEPGFYTVPVGVADFASLYPSTIISENISHDTLVWVKDYDLSGKLIGISWGSEEYDGVPGERYTDIEFDLWGFREDDMRKHKEKVKKGLRVCRYAQNVVGTVPRIVDGLLKARAAKRAEIKKASDPFVKALLDSEQLAYKLTANSLYGQLGSGCFKVRHQALAASVTAYGRKQIMFAKSIIEDFYGPESGNPKSSSKIVYGDTDSLFIAFHPKNPETGVPLEGQEALEATIHLTEEAGKLVTQVLKPPHDFEFDKVYWPFLIFSKKRYVGHKYEEADHHCLTSMGIALKRRDYAPIVKKIYGGAIHILLTEKNVPKAAEFVKQTAMDLVEGKFGLGPLTISKSLRAEYANPNAIAHKVLADRIAERDPGNAPASGDRIAYIYVQSPPGQKAPDLQGDRIETPTYIKKHGLKPDTVYYIEHQISSPVCQMFALLLEGLPEAKELIRGLPSDPVKAQTARETIAYDILFKKALQRNTSSATRAFLSMLGQVAPSQGGALNPIITKKPRVAVASSTVVTRKQSTLDAMFMDQGLLNARKVVEKGKEKEKKTAERASKSKSLTS